MRRISCKTYNYLYETRLYSCVFNVYLCETRDYSHVLLIVDHHQSDLGRRSLSHGGLADQVPSGQRVCVRGVQGEWKQLGGNGELWYHQDHVPAQVRPRARGGYCGVRLVREGGH